MAKKEVKKRLPNVTFEGARLMFRNFSGVERDYNRAGDRNFNVVLDNDTAEAMMKDGWAVKILQPKEEGDEPLPILKVKLKFGDFPPIIKQITCNGMTKLDEDTVGTLDTARIENVDLIISPYEWHVNGKSGITAYLKKMYVTIEDDELEKKYSRIEGRADEEGLPFGD